MGSAIGTGAVTALVLTLGVFGGARENVITGVAMLSFALGWLLLAILSVRFTDQPQRWAVVPAAATAVTGTALLIFAPGDSTIAALGWAWPPAVPGLAVWTSVKARHHLRNWSRRLVVYPVAAVMALCAIGGGIETAVAATPAMPAQGRLVDVGDHRLYLECTGTGSPTVVLSNGFSEHTPIGRGSPRRSPNTPGSVSTTAQGSGGATPPPSPQDGNQVADDLHTLLHNAQIPGPYLLAGHSSGGIYRLIFAARYPTDLAGLVLLDSATPEQFSALPDYPSVLMIGPLGERLTGLGD